MTKRIDHPFEVRPLSVEEGCGFLISCPDFSDCLADGETVEKISGPVCLHTIGLR